MPKREVRCQSKKGVGETHDGSLIWKQKQDQNIENFFCKLIARLVEKIDIKTLRGLESPGNKLSNAISPILLQCL